MYIYIHIYIYIYTYIYINGMMIHSFLNPCMSVLAMRNVLLASDFGTHVDESLLPRHCGKVEPEQDVERVYSQQTAAEHAQEAAGAQSQSKAADTLHNKLLKLIYSSWLHQLHLQFSHIIHIHRLLCLGLANVTHHMKRNMRTPLPSNQCRLRAIQGLTRVYGSSCNSTIH